MSASPDKSAKLEAPGQSAFSAASTLVGVYGEQLFRILEQTSNGYVLLDSQNRVQRWNDGYLRLFTWLTPSLRVGVPLHTALQSMVATAPSESAQAIRHITDSHLVLINRTQPSIQLQLPNGRKLSMSAHALSASYTVLACKELVDTDSDEAGPTFFDTVTNLPNRRLLLDRLSQAMIQSERTGWRGALLTINMKPAGKQGDSLNYGEQAYLAQNISQRLLNCVRACDTVARLEALRFVIMVSDLSPSVELANLLIERLGERLQEALKSHYQLSDKTVALEAHIGATLFGPHSRSATDLLLQGEMASQKQCDPENRNIHFFSTESKPQSADHSQMTQDLREAVRQGQFELHYQPQYSVYGDVNNLEALLRWRHPTRGFLPPGVFLSIAEESDTIALLERWALRTACEQLARWEADPQLSKHSICVNIGPKQLIQPDFADQVESILTQTGINPESLMLEFSIRSVHPMSAETSRTLKRIHTLGIKLSLDNFGGACSTPEVVQQLPLKQIKLAHSLVQRLGPHNASEAAIQAAIALAKQHKITVVGAGVETLEQRALLIQSGCQEFIGYLFSAPVPVNQLRSLLQKKAFFTPQKYVA